MKSIKLTVKACFTTDLGINTPLTRVILTVVLSTLVYYNNDITTLFLNVP